MPRYDFACRSCGIEFEANVPVAERDNVACPRCGAVLGVVRRAVYPVAVHLWKPQFFEHIDVKPIWIESKRQLKEECAKRGLIPIGLE